MGDTSRRRRRIWTIQFIGLTALVMVLVTGTVAFGDEPPGAAVDEGYLLLQLGPGGDRLVWDQGGDGGADPTDPSQAINTQGCRASLASGGTILASIDAFVLDGSGDPDLTAAQLGRFDDGLGGRVQGRGGNGQPCGRVDGPDEGLVVSLAGDLADMEIIEAQLDIEGKFNVIVVGDLYNDGAYVDTVTLATGDRSDSGPDSADGDNYRWLIEVGSPFDTIYMTVDPDTPDGAFSLHGGADGTTPGSFGITESAFKLQVSGDGLVACAGDTHIEGDGETTPRAVFTRGSTTLGKPDGCGELVLYSLDSTLIGSSQEVTFTYDESLNPTWLGVITWAPETAVVPVPATLVDADGDGTYETSLDWCDGFAGTPDPMTGEYPDDPVLGEPLPVMPAGASWCLVDQSSALIDADDMQVTQKIYGITDPKFGRV